METGFERDLADIFVQCKVVLEYLIIDGVFLVGVGEFGIFDCSPRGGQEGELSLPPETSFLGCMVEWE